jgi:hypothetical protein
MLSRLAQSAGALALAPLLAGAAERKFKIGICEWSLGKSDPSSFDLAKQIGLEGVQITLGTVANGLNLRQPAVQQVYRAVLPPGPSARGGRGGQTRVRGKAGCRGRHGGAFRD